MTQHACKYTMPVDPNVLDAETIRDASTAAAKRIAPAWPLSATVAVNPYLGLSKLDLAQTADLLDRLSAAPTFMDRPWYLGKIDAGEISDADLDAALSSCRYAGKPSDLDALKTSARVNRPASQYIPTVLDLAAAPRHKSWRDVFTSNFGAWAGSYFDRGQALWATPAGRPAWSAWCDWAVHDITPEIDGLEGFASFVNDLPRNPEVAMVTALNRLGIHEEDLDLYLHQLLASLGGWAQHARYLQWCAERDGSTDETIIHLLAIRLAWEEAVFLNAGETIERAWAEARGQRSVAQEPPEAFIVDAILQDAAERAYQRLLIQSFTNTDGRHQSDDARPALQAAFCIDVRSEVYRRALESLDGNIETLGFAGFFGITTQHRRFASDVGEHRLPVLLSAQSKSRTIGTESDELRSRFAARALRAVGRFKLAAVSSFAFVEAMGPIFIGKLIRDALRAGDRLAIESMPKLEDELALDSKIDAAEKILRAMSLTSTFAPEVLLVGHGASTTNNPFQSALNCGACGGHAGDVNARLLARLLNDAKVREGLEGRAIDIPEDTVFIAALHDTTRDTVFLFEEDTPLISRKQSLIRIKKWLEDAGALARAERAKRLPGSENDKDILHRARDWAETRPEWGLAGCAAFVAAPRALTSHADLGGRVFLHNYDWHTDRDNGFAVLELILTAPVVVASWISLQYYGSTVAPATFGSGDKTLHNIVGGIGVVEGNGGNLRTGLPWQSVHDGTDYAHDPLRLTVCIAAPTDAIDEILARHTDVRDLFENKWLHMLAINDEPGTVLRYVGNGTWESETPMAKIAA